MTRAVTMRVLLAAMMLAFAAFGFIAVAVEPAAAIPPCDLSFPGERCCWYWGEHGIYWEPC